MINNIMLMISDMINIIYISLIAPRIDLERSEEYYPSVYISKADIGDL